MIKPISIAPLLKQQSPSRHFDHGWLEMPDGNIWNPVIKKRPICQAQKKRNTVSKRLFS
ncbi:phage filamentation protein Fil family protein [Rahnella rivi]|uniref:phage filamentation protein Fil family protein n=1 Tax=Rahnella rivi TaxID=2816249 RepID=UPI0039BE3445